MVMSALHRKLLRDLTRMWSQVLTIALVVASGVGGLHHKFVCGGFAGAGA